MSTHGHGSLFPELMLHPTCFCMMVDLHAVGPHVHLPGLCEHGPDMLAASVTTLGPVGVRERFRRSATGLETAGRQDSRGRPQRLFKFSARLVSFCDCHQPFSLGPVRHKSLHGI